MAQQAARQLKLQVPMAWLMVILQGFQAYLWINMLSSLMKSWLLRLMTSALLTKLDKVVLVLFTMLSSEKAAIKKMDMEAMREFLAELKVLTNVHHLNLVPLIGYCVEGSLFLVYEYVENGHIGQHLRGTGRDPLPWSKRVQIALDSASGLEYIHEHTVPVYIHRDIKTVNILIDKNFHAKVADFGLTKLTKVGSSSLQTRLVGTFGYMPLEYAQYGDVSPKVDVYAFGVVLYELISAKEAIVKPNGSVTDSKGLVALLNSFCIFLFSVVRLHGSFISLSRIIFF
ncbi:lysM domain receptor-like kinase 3 isoform X5 [Capsicum annuum]|uniref:lysM domain receptor-like kinase 3 isoform X5 n=1 Tax=Capsicum annuum TaxID=4072 RepID=UPI001FB087C3|nr:lysM domain receptor-like kinase 3 isoform X5 [Capsicum annuum]XP_047249802.1 lysM domain receptor-like kinase 3 isoform X5 [Capsicum annuum]XP_047249803.1 lysM domain receptor-like kinase 3 isoform X5 [Capsicum annuum]XP_047249804.1 lysM domain receptor-like kinase 3 isoform X5 [Capsicum annuum]XP_047249805.1 lysM domain receptor-like kinase 3 isoform X5 [Capsicum annuum]